jgi:hypothetical protein
MKVRPLEEQFESNTVLRVRAIQERLSALHRLGMVPRYAAVEAEQCLEAGLLFATLQVSCAILEFAIRRAVVRARKAQQQAAACLSDAAREVGRRVKEAEDDRDLTFGPMLEELIASHVLTEDEAAIMHGIYRSVRNPVQHGILLRYVRDRTDKRMIEILDTVGRGHGFDSRSVEEAFHDHALVELGGILTQLELVARKIAL